MSRSEDRDALSAEHRLKISDGKSGTRWVTNLYTSQERQVSAEEAEALVDSSEWRRGRACSRWGRHAGTLTV